jgi:hypothetical protein
VPPPDRLRPVEPPRIDLAVDDRGQTWRGRCAWSLTGDPALCDTFVYARLDPGPPIVVTTPPPLTKRPLPVVEPAPGFTIGVRGEPAALACRSGDQPVEYPSAEERGSGDFLGMTDVTWLANDPPIFESYRGIDGIVPHGAWIVFEGCEPSKRFPFADVVVGPHGIVAVAAFDDMVVIWRGRVIGTLDKVDRVAFAPR